MVERQVRNPRFQMPAFSETQVSDEELKAIGQYIGNLSGDDHAHPEEIEQTAAVETHHWMALEALKADDQAEAVHHVNHIIELLQSGEHRDRMAAVQISLKEGEVHGPEHEIESMLAASASPGLDLFQLHLRQALITLAVEDTSDSEHHVTHALELSDSAVVEDVLELLQGGKLHQAEHEIRELLGEDEHRD